MKDKNKIGSKLRRLRIRLKYTQEDVATMCELSLYDLIDIEKGNRHPSDAVLKMLLKLYGVTEDQLLRDNFVDHAKRIKTINYIQIIISGLLILGYLLPFTFHFYGPEETVIPEYPGYMLLFNDQHGYPWVVSIVFIVFLVQFGLHIGLYLKKRKVSNIFKVIFLMMNFTSIVLLYLDANWNYNLMQSTMWGFIFMLSIHIAITLFDLIQYPLNHDTKADLSKMRRLFTLFIMIFYSVFYVSVIIDLFNNRYRMALIDILVYVVFGMYLVIYFFIRKSLLETRRNVSIFIAFPAVMFLILNIVSLIGGTIDINDLIYGQFLIILMLFLPVLVVNIDYFIELIRNIVTKGDIKEV